MLGIAIVTSWRGRFGRVLFPRTELLAKYTRGYAFGPLGLRSVVSDHSPDSVAISGFTVV